MQPGLLLKVGNGVKFGKVLGFGLLYFCFLFLLNLGSSVNGANRWIMLGPMSLQPSELAKVAGVIWTLLFGETDQ